MKINFSLNQETKPFQKTITNLYNVALNQTGITNQISVNVVLVSPEEIKEMNKNYRSIDKVTDVLSFPMIDNFDNIESEKDFVLGEVNIGDIYINLERAKEQAKEYNHSLKREFCFLALHGFLHLLGFDHIEKSDEEKMLEMQNKVLDIAKLVRE